MGDMFSCLTGGEWKQVGFETSQEKKVFLGSAVKPSSASKQYHIEIKNTQGDEENQTLLVKPQF